MTGLVSQKSNQKTHQKQAVLKNETLKESFENSTQTTKTNPRPDKPKFSLNGILGLNQTIEFHKSGSETKTEKVLFGTPNHVEIELQQLKAQEASQTQQAIRELLSQIKQLMTTTDVASHELVVAADTPVVEANDYELNFLQRIVSLVRLATRAVGEVCLWADSFNSKKKKKNYFWKKSLNKKGGQSFMFSDEHSAARSVN